jgi:Tol biopolymer transport system component
LASPDGRWLYWQAETEGGWRIFRGTREGSASGIVAPGPARGRERREAYGLAGSADGTYLTYTLHEGNIGRVVLARADGSEPGVLAEKAGYLYMACPDAHGRRVVCSGPAQGYRLVLLAPESETVRVLTPDLPDCYVPQFCPDETTIIFTRREGGLYRIASDGTDLRRLAGEVQVEFFLSPADAHGSTDKPAVAPDGSAVAYVARDAAGIPNVFVISLEGGRPRQITQMAAACGRVRWSPDGRWLAFVAFTGDRPQLHVVPADGSDAPVQLTSGTGAVCEFCWLPAVG